MACHTANMAFRALKLAHPIAVSAESGEVNPETYPAGPSVTIEFPAREDMPPGHAQLVRGQEGRQARAAARGAARPRSSSTGEKLADSGSILVGERASSSRPTTTARVPHHARASWREGKNLKTPETTPRQRQGDQGMKNEWVEAIKAGKPEIAYSNFDIASLLTEAFLLGNVAIKTGKRLEWDGPGLKVTNVPEANQLIQTEYRRGWEVTRAERSNARRGPARASRLAETHPRESPRRTARQGQDLTDRRVEFLEADRLGHVGGEAGLQAPLDVLLHPEAADGDGRDRPPGLEPAGSSRPLPSGSPTSLMIRSNSPASAVVDRLGEGRRGRHADGRGPGGSAPEDVERLGLVLDQEDLQGRRPRVVRTESASRRRVRDTARRRAGRRARCGRSRRGPGRGSPP